MVPFWLRRQVCSICLWAWLCLFTCFHYVEAGVQLEVCDLRNGAFCADLFCIENAGLVLFVAKVP